MELTIQQQRAQFALQRVQALQRDLNTQQQVAFISYASSLPAMIHMNGLGQAMAFCQLKSKDSEAYIALYNMVSDWLKKPDQPYEGKDVLTGITQCDMRQYQLAQAESLILMSWVKKFAKAFLDEAMV